MVISTEEDVIRVIRENPRLLFQALYEDPELLNEVRRLVMTEDVLAMPGQLSEVVERLDEVVERQDRVEIRLDEVVERQDRMETRLDEVSNTQKDMLNTQKRMDDHLGFLIGAELEREIVRILPSRLNSMYGLYRTRVMQGRGIWSERVDAFMDEVEDADLASAITEDQKRRIEETDMIVRALRRSGGETIYISVEASATVRERDITRANDTAVALRAAFGAESAAVVTGYEIRSEDRQRAEDMGVELIILERPLH